MHVLKTAIFLTAIFTLVCSKNIAAQKTKARLEFKDGTVKKGLAKLSGIDKVKFKAKKEDKATKYHFSELRKVSIGQGEESLTYAYIKVDIDTYKVLEEVAIGKVSLYTMEFSGYSGPVYMAGPNGGSWSGGGGHFYNIKNLFVLREGEEMATHLGSNQLFTKNFKKAASAYFKDCSKLVRKIQNKEYKKKHIKNIVNYYNKQCQKLAR